MGSRTRPAAQPPREDALATIRARASDLWQAAIALSSPLFASLILAAFAVAGILVAAGISSTARLRDERAEIWANNRATAPILYGDTMVVVDRAALEHSPPGAREDHGRRPPFSIAFGLDSIPTNGEAEICDSVRSVASWAARLGIGTLYVSVAATRNDRKLMACARDLDVAHVRHRWPSDSIGIQIRPTQFRWALLGDDGVVLYSRGELPAVLDVDRVVKLFGRQQLEPGSPHP